MFDSAEELLDKIRLGEDTALELKSVSFRGSRVDGPSRNDLADELAAFANTNDGVLLLGVDDKSREVEGIPTEKLDVLESWIHEICNDSIKPPLTVRIFRIRLPDALGNEQPIIKIDIPKSLFVHKSPHGYFLRVGSSKREMPPELLARLFQQRSQARLIRFDEQPVPDTSFEDLDQDLWSRFTAGVDGDPRTTLQKLRILVPDDQAKERASVGGVLVCSEDPSRWLAGAYIQAVRYRGEVRDANYQLDAQDIKGPLDRQVEQALAFIKKNMNVMAVKEPARREIPQYSIRAAFEAVVNAVAHRDYSIHGSKIRLFMFNDRLELYSPGPPPNTVTLDSLALRQVTRNELITSFLAKCPVRSDRKDLVREYLMDKRGDGVPIILRESESLSGKTPQYQLIDDTELLLTIYAASMPENPSAG